MTRTITTREEFDALVMGVEHSAFRLETRERYEEPDETEHLARFLAGEPDTDHRWYRHWPDFIADRHTNGIRFERLRVVTWPPSDYALFGMQMVALAVAAGERITYIDRADAAQLDIPMEDFWLLDEARVLTLRFDDDGRLREANLTDDRPRLTDALTVRNLARQHGRPPPAFLREHLSPR